MSFLNKSKPAAPESATYFASKQDARDRNPTEPSSSQSKEDIMGGLHAFREDLRKQISQKVNRSLKSLDVSSPSTSSELKVLYTVKNNATPNQKGSSYLKDDDGLWSTKATQSKLDNNKDFGNRGGRASPLKQLSNHKSSEFLGLFNQGKESHRLSETLKEFNNLGNKSPFNRKESPKKEGYRSTLDIKPLEHFKKDSDQKSFLAPRSSAGKPDLKDDIKQIFNTIKPPRTRPELITSKPGLTEQVNSNLRSVGLLNSNTLHGYDSNSSASLKTTASALENLKNSRYLVKDNGRNGGLLEKAIQGAVQEEQSRPKKRLDMDLKSLNIVSPVRKVGATESLSLLKLEIGAREREREREKGRDSERKETLISEQLPVEKVFQIQDLFYNVTDRGFDQLSPDYIEELIKLSSVIMHRVKNSSYYNKS